MNKDKKIMLLYGGISAEREISIITSKEISKSLKFLIDEIKKTMRFLLLIILVHSLIDSINIIGIFLSPLNISLFNVS